MQDKTYLYRQQQYELNKEISDLRMQIAQLEVEKVEIAKQMQQQDQLIAKQMQQQDQLVSQLQLGLLKKHARINELLIKNKQLVSEFVRYNAELKNKDSKVEAVRLLAEVSTLVETAKNRYTTRKAKKNIETATQYLEESAVELKADNYEGGSFLAYQALDIIHSLGTEEITRFEEEEISFTLHLPMKVIHQAKVREKPAKNSRIVALERKGVIVDIVGFKGHWVRVESGEYGGWIHHSSLSGLPH